MTTLYEIKSDNAKQYSCKVVLKRTGKVVFYGTRTECREWIERNDGDEWN
jgi:hypothetical protein